MCWMSSSSRCADHEQSNRTTQETQPDQLTCREQSNFLRNFAFLLVVHFLDHFFCRNRRRLWQSSFAGSTLMIMDIDNSHKNCFVVVFKAWSVFSGWNFEPQLLI